MANPVYTGLRTTVRITRLRMTVILTYLFYSNYDDHYRASAFSCFLFIISLCLKKDVLSCEVRPILLSDEEKELVRVTSPSGPEEACCE